MPNKRRRDAAARARSHPRAFAAPAAAATAPARTFDPDEQRHGGEPARVLSRSALDDLSAIVSAYFGMQADGSLPAHLRHRGNGKLGERQRRARRTLATVSQFVGVEPSPAFGAVPVRVASAGPLGRLSDVVDDFGHDVQDGTARLRDVSPRSPCGAPAPSVDVWMTHDGDGLGVRLKWADGVTVGNVIPFATIRAKSYPATVCGMFRANLHAVLVAHERGTQSRVASVDALNLSELVPVIQAAQRGTTDGTSAAGVAAALRDVSPYRDDDR